MRSLYDSPEACLEHYEQVLNSSMTAIYSALPKLEVVASKKFYRGSSKALEYMSELTFAIGYSRNDANEIRVQEEIESYASAIDDHYQQLFDTMRVELGLKKPEICT
jgi:Mg2+ and Co2+ transporter CorA